LWLEPAVLYSYILSNYSLAYIVSINPLTGENITKTKLNNPGLVSLLPDPYRNTLYVINGEALAVTPENHLVLWKNSMKGMDSEGWSLQLYRDYLFVGSSGKVACLNHQTGERKWLTSFPGWYKSVFVLIIDSV
jgi:outer membrane protein assembly factor BamB